MKFAPRDSVRKNDDTEHVYIVEWTHTDGVTIARRRPGTIEVTDIATRIKVEANQLSFAHPSLQFFAWVHLPEYLQTISQPFGRVAHLMVLSLPANSQLDVMLQHLLEAKDAAVRARLSE